MTRRYPVVKPELRSCDEPFVHNGEEVGLRLGDFWAWSSPDLVVNTNRGLLAEFLVSQLLGDAEATRDPWRPYDVETRDGTSVEVKSGAYLQAWAQDQHSALSFGVSPSRAWSPETGKWEEVRKRQAQVYVFAVLSHKEQESLDPMDLGQWTFYVVATEVLDKELGSAKSIGLSRLLKIGAKKVSYTGLQEAVRTAAGI